jgi:hypothetical protein
LRWAGTQLGIYSTAHNVRYPQTTTKKGDHVRFSI